MKNLTILIVTVLFSISSFAQKFEKEKIGADEFGNVNVKVGGDFAIQLQALDHEAPVELIELKNNFNLPTANLNLTSDLAPGVQLYINTYLSSRHHNEAWVEGGYLVLDYLPFWPASNNIMEYLTVKAGVMMLNYGDAHFFRSNNASVLDNPFVGNWIMDAYTTNPGLEVLYRNSGIIALAGVNNGRVNYGRGNDIGEDLVFNWKLGYDTDINQDLRVRGTVSGFHVGEGHSGAYLWGGDRAGARYYSVMQAADAEGDNFTSGRWAPGSGQSQMNSYMANLFLQFHGLELFGIYEDMNGVRNGNDQNFTQTALQVVYHIGDFYAGTRLNKVSNNDGSTVNRTNIGAGWYMIDNIVMKLDYVIQKYDGPAHGDINEGQFSGIVFEAGISF